MPDPRNTRPLVGLALQPEEVFFEHAGELIERRAELFEVTPETLWDADCEPTPGRQRLLELCRRRALPVVGHGVLFSLGATRPGARRAPWLRALQRDAEAFGFRWLSEHLGFADAGGQHTAWPLPMPPSRESVEVAAASLTQLRAVCDTVLFENNADLFSIGDPMQQATLYGQICEAADAYLLLDLHNAFAFARNAGIALERFLDELPWSRVLQIHLSGGSDSDPDFLPSRRSMRLDSHDGAVPDEVWRAFEIALTRADALRAVVCEWFPDAMDAGAGRQFAADFDKAHEMVVAAYRSC